MVVVASSVVVVASAVVVVVASAVVVVAYVSNDVNCRKESPSVVERDCIWTMRFSASLQRSGTSCFSDLCVCIKQPSPLQFE